jgi:hypothetical protein
LQDDEAFNGHRDRPPLVISVSLKHCLNQDYSPYFREGGGLNRF